MTYITIENNDLLYVASRRGVCIKVSVPAITSNEWINKTMFLDLPLMDKESFNGFVDALIEFKKLFKDD